MGTLGWLIRPLIPSIYQETAETIARPVLFSGSFVALRINV
jgi:hypothetical protein